MARRVGDLIVVTGFQAEVAPTGVPAFNEVHVVSDLHFGGPEPRFQVFNQGRRLANTIDALRARDAATVALVLNGDVVDFLAENPPKDGLDVVNVISKLRRIVEDPAFSPVFVALRAFVAAKGRHLVFVLGNHDVELALPQAREWLAAWLSNGSPEARGRLTFATEGGGFACDVGSKRVLCVHGNEVDEWNVVDYGELLRVIRAINRGMTPPAWSANAGTRMVIDVMNDIKRRLPVVDLLKPELRAAIPVVAALDPSKARAAGRVAGLLAQKTLDQLRMRLGFLNDGADQPVLSDGLEDGAALEGGSESRIALDERLLRIQRRLDAGDDSELPADGEFLAWGDKASRGDMLRSALTRWLKNDRSYALDEEDDQFRRLDRIVGSGVHYLIAGHTHLRRALVRKAVDSVTGAKRFYFNTGTWIRLIELPSAVLDDPELFRPVYETFDAGSLQALDSARLGPNDSGVPLIKLDSTVASIVESGTDVWGALFDADDNGGLQEIPHSRFP